MGPSVREIEDQARVVPSSRRAVISGIGIVSPAGIGSDPFWSAIVSGRSLIGPIARFQADSYPCRIAAEIPDSLMRELVPQRSPRATTRATLYALAAAQLAIDDARIDLDRYSPFRTGTSFGTSLGGFHEACQQNAVLLEKGAGRVNPFLAGGSANHVAGLEVATTYGLRGPSFTLSTSCAASLQAIGHAADLVRGGHADLMIAGGTEAPISPLVIAAMSRSHELSTANDVPERACRPFDREHDGLVLSEGSVAFVVERLDRVVARGGSAYAEIVAQSSGIDGTGMFAVDETGQAAASLARCCLRQADLSPADLSYVCANGNSLPSLDRKEVRVLGQLLGDAAPSIPVSSVKSVLGHPLGAASAFQVAASCLAMREGVIPPNFNLVDPDEPSELDLPVLTPRRATLRHVLVCSYGFGGVNAFMLLGAANGNGTAGGPPG